MLPEASPNSSWLLWSAGTLAARKINPIAFYYSKCVPGGLLLVGFNREYLISFKGILNFILIFQEPLTIPLCTLCILLCQTVLLHCTSNVFFSSL